MTDLDELRILWQEQDRTLQSLVRLNHRLLDATALSRARSAVQRFVALLAVETIVVAIVILAVGSFVAAHAGEPRLAISGAITGVYAIATFATLVAQLVLARRIDYSGPVTMIQTALEHLRVVRSRAIQALVLAGTVCWLPLTVVLLDLAAGVDTSAVLEPAYVAANVTFGVAVVALAFWLSRRFADRPGISPAIRRAMRALAGTNLAAASAALRSIAEFEGQQRPRESRAPVT